MGKYLSFVYLWRMGLDGWSILGLTGWKHGGLGLAANRWTMRWLKWTVREVRITRRCKSNAATSAGWLRLMNDIDYVLLATVIGSI